MKLDRKFLPTIAELIDRLAIHQLKEIFLSEHKDKYKREMCDIAYDLDQIIEELDLKLTGELIRSIVVLSQINAHIWYNESKARLGATQDFSLLRLTHGLNGIRNNAQNYILELIGQADRRDWKTDCLAAEFSDWQVSLGSNKEDK